MPQSARILTTACPKPAVPLEDYQREYGRVTRSASPQRSRYTGPSSFPPSCTVQRPGVLHRKQIRLLEQFHQRCLRSILGIKWQDHMSNEEVLKRASLPAHPRVHLASRAAALGWPRHKDGSTHAQSSLLQRAPRRKTRSWCSKKALQRPVEETACTGGNQSSVMAAGGLRSRQLALISEKSQLRVRGRKA